MKRLIFIILFFSLFQLSISSHRYEFEGVKINSNSHIKFKVDDSEDLNNDDTEPDLDDCIDVDLWNKLNDMDIKHAPQIANYSSELEARRWLEWYYRIIRRYDQIDTKLQFDYSTNITIENEQAIISQSRIQTEFTTKRLPIGKAFNKHLINTKDEDLKRILSRLAIDAARSNSKNTKAITDLVTKMEDIYAKTEVCEEYDEKTCYTISPYLERIMQKEKDYDRLLWAWKNWHNGCGNQIRYHYIPYIDLLTENAKKNGYQDLSKLWIEEYGMGDTAEFDSTMNKLLEDIMPFYKQLHAYVRGRLCSIYPYKFDCHGPIPAHLLGNMWAEHWHDRFDDLYPYPNTPLVDLKEKFKEKRYTIHKMYKTAEDFLTSIGLDTMKPKFWAYSMFEKPTDRNVDCEAHASDFKYHDDYRVRMCTQTDEDNFYTIHHEMSLIEYYMAHDKNQPYVYQNEANPGFYDAIGDTIAMYATSPKHLAKLGLLDSDDINGRYQINYLMRLALKKVAFIPFSYIMDKYRSLLFRNQIDRDHELNSMWWALHIEHTGIMAALPRSDETNFDPGAKYHIIGNIPYYKYFISNILQFQFFRSLCQSQGKIEKLHMCDVYGDKYVGMKLKEMLAMGNSKSWEKTLYTLTGEKKLESKALLDYFAPLHEWLKIENSRKNYPVGWM